MEDSLTMMNKGGNVFAGRDVPNPNGRVRRAGYNDPLVVLQTQYGSRVTCQNALTSQTLAIPHLDGVISQTRNDFLIVVLEAIDTFGIFTTAIDSLKVVFATSPVTFNGLNILK